MKKQRYKDTETLGPSDPSTRALTTIPQERVQPVNLPKDSRLAEGPKLRPQQVLLANIAPSQPNAHIVSVHGQASPGQEEESTVVSEG